MTDTKILIVEDDHPWSAHLSEFLENLGYTANTAVSCGRQAIEIAADLSPGLALVDLGLEGEISGPQTGEGLASGFDIPVIYLTDGTDGELLQRAQATHPFGYVLRPFDERQLHLNIQTALSMHARENRHKETRAHLKRLVGKYKDLTRLLKTVFNAMSEGVVAVDGKGVPVVYNESAAKLAGSNPREEDIRKWPERYGVFQPDGKTVLAADQNPLLLALEGQATDGVELFIHNELDSEGYHVSVSGRPLQTGMEGHGGGVIVLRDITRQKKAAAELEETVRELRYQSELMETTFKSISDGIVVADAEGDFLYVNPGAEQIVGMGRTEGSQEDWAETYGAYYPDRETPMKTEDLPLIRAIHRGESTDEEDVFIRNQKRPNGVYIRVSGRPLLDNIGGIRGGVIIFRDVTERRLAEEALAIAFAQGRLEVVDTILHNIGNAINSVTTGIETMRQTLVNDRLGRRLYALAAAVKEHRDDWAGYIEDDPQGRKVMPFIIALSEGFSKRNDELAKTVLRVRDRANHIAEIVRTQKALHRSTMDRKDIDLQDAFSGAVRVLRDSINKRRIQVAIDCQDAPREIRIQESQFHQMLINLVKNSIEAIDDLAATQGLEETPRIRIKACAKGDFLNLEVRDNGIGIKKKDAQLIFAPGYTTKKSGSGLGLHSAANFVIGSGGRIRAMSDGTGKGAAMLVRLPLSSVAPQSTAG